MASNEPNRFQPSQGTQKPNARENSAQAFREGIAPWGRNGILYLPPYPCSIHRATLQHELVIGPPVAPVF